MFSLNTKYEHEMVDQMKNSQQLYPKGYNFLHRSYLKLHIGGKGGRQNFSKVQKI